MKNVSINDIIPIDHVVSTAKAFIERAGRQLEFEDGIIVDIPEDVELRVASRAFIQEDIEDYTWGDHYQAKVIIGPCDEQGHCPEFGTLGIYFNEDGIMISEDRFKD